MVLSIWPAHGLSHQIEREGGEYFGDDAHPGWFDGELGAMLVVWIAQFPYGKCGPSIDTL